MRFKPGVRISFELCSSQLRSRATDFSVKEKDEACLPNRFRRDLLNAFIHRFAGV